MNDMMGFVSQLPWGDIGASVLLVAAIIALRWGVVRLIRGNAETLSPDKRKWVSFVRNGSSVLIIVTLLMVWALELSQFALSIAAFALAIVIASKELILCLTGGLYRTLTNPFESGDWVKIGNHRGEVFHEGLLITQLIELSESDHLSYVFTGNTLSIPNATLLTNVVVNLNAARRFVYHEFTFTAPPEDVLPEEDIAFVKATSDAVWAEHKDLAERYWGLVRRRLGVETGLPAPLVMISTTDMAYIEFRIRMFCPRDDAVELEQQIMQAFLGRLAERRREGKKPPQADEDSPSDST